MIYSCKKCLYVFESKKEPERCPDCGNPTIHVASDKEKTEYEKNKEQLLRDGEM